MRKEMLKPVSKIFALCIVLSMFVGNGANASAAQGGGCPFDEYGYHYYNQHKGTSDGYYEYGTHEHKMGYDKYGQEVFESCQWSAYYRYYIDVCACGAVQSGSRVVELEYMNHSATAR